MPDTKALMIDVISDFVCPWCWIGKRGVDELMRSRKVVRVWRPYFLNPDLPPEGMDRATLMRIKFGPEAARGMGDAIAAAGREVDLDFRFDRIERVPNTLNAHRLVRWATGQGMQDAVAEGLFTAYFRHGQDIGNADVLVRIGAEAGLRADLVGDLLKGIADREAVASPRAGCGLWVFPACHRIFWAGRRCWRVPRPAIPSLRLRTGSR